MALGTVGALTLGTIGSSLIGGISANKAAEKQVEASELANETQRYIFDRSVDITEPQRQVGLNALNQLAVDMDVSPIASITSSPLTIQEFQEQLPVSGAIRPQATPSPTGVQGWDQRQSGDNMGGFAPGEEHLVRTPYTPAGGQTPSYATRFRVGDQVFDTRDAAQNYVNQNTATYNAPTGLTKQMPEFGEFEEDPGYQFRLSEGQKALERQQSARGIRLGGAAMKDAMRFGDGLASQEYSAWWNRQRANQTDYFNRLSSLAGLGTQANQQQINAGTSYANAFGQNALAGGTAAANGIMGVNNAVQGGIDGMFNILGMQQAGYFS